MRHVTPEGEYVIEQRDIRFRCVIPWPIPGERIIIVCQPDIYGLIAHVNDLGEEGWISAKIRGKVYGLSLAERVEPIGSKS